MNVIPMTDEEFVRLAEKMRRKNVAFAKYRVREEQYGFIIQAAIKTGSGRSIDIIRTIPEVIEEQLRLEGRQPTPQEVKRHLRSERQYKRYIADLIKRRDLIRNESDIIRPAGRLLEQQEIRRLFAKYLGHSLAFTCYPAVVKKNGKKVSIAFGGRRQREEVIRQLVERIGLYALYLFMKAVEPTSTRKPASQYNEEMRSFVKEAFDMLQLFSIFAINVLSAPTGEPEIDRQRYHDMDSDDYASLERLLIGMYGERFKELQHCEQEFYRQFPAFANLKEEEPSGSLADSRARSSHALSRLSLPGQAL
jgi:hypothetical protein